MENLNDTLKKKYTYEECKDIFKNYLDKCVLSENDSSNTFCKKYANYLEFKCNLSATPPNVIPNLLTKK